MVKIRFDISEEMMSKLNKLRQEEEKASRSNVLREAVQNAVLRTKAEQSGKLRFLRPNRAGDFFAYTNDTGDLIDFAGVGADDFASHRSRVDREVRQVLEQKKQEQARRGAQARHEKSPYAKIKALVIAEYEAHAAEMKPDGQPLYKNQQAFIRTMMAQHLDVADEQTIRGWIKKSQLVVPHWKTRARKSPI